MTSTLRRAPLSAHEAEPSRCNDFVRLRALARVPLLTGLDEPALRIIDARCTLSHRQAGEAVHRRGQPAERLFIPVFGAVKLTRTSSGGEEVLLDIVGRGELLGGLPALGDETYADTAIALTPTCLLSLTGEGFNWAVRTYPQVSRTTLRLVGQRLRRAHLALERSTTATAEQRIAATLLTLAERLGTERDGVLLIDAPLTREDLASLAGTAPETASRILSRLRRAGLIHTGRRWVAIRDSAALRALTT